MSIGYKIPSVVHSEQGQQRIMWKPKKYEEKDAENEKNNTIVKPNKQPKARLFQCAFQQMTTNLVWKKEK